MFFGQSVMQLNVYGLYLKLMLTFRCSELLFFVCIIVCLFLPVWRNKGVHMYGLTIKRMHGSALCCVVSD